MSPACAGTLDAAQSDLIRNESCKPDAIEWSCTRACTDKNALFVGAFSDGALRGVRRQTQ